MAIEPRAVPEPLMTPKYTADFLGMTVGALAQMRYLGTGPVFIKLGGRSVRYRQSDIDEWVARCTRTRTDDRSAPRAG